MQNKLLLLPCPFCGGEAELEEFYETCDGRGDRWAKIKCKCGVKMELTLEEWGKAQDDFNYTGGYYSQNKAFWNGMHQRLIDKWNTRKPMGDVASKVQQVIWDSCSGDEYKYASKEIEKIFNEVYVEGGVDNG